VLPLSEWRCVKTFVMANLLLLNEDRSIVV
jgi:hypothetical protein